MTNIIKLIHIPCFQPIIVFPPAHFHFEISHPISAKVPRLSQPIGVLRLPEGVYLRCIHYRIGDPLESSIVPEDVFLAAIEICKARARRNFGKANDLCQKTRQVGYWLINHENKRILACKYWFRLKGIDAPENDMPYGKEAKEKLIKLVHGKQLMILVYDMDRYGRYVTYRGLWVRRRSVRVGVPCRRLEEFRVGGLVSRRRERAVGGDVKRRRGVSVLGGRQREKRERKLRKF
ncbi:hypothetical protein SCA6_017297 [Theobroma cacao]